MRISRSPLTRALLSTAALALAVPAVASLAFATPATAQQAQKRSQGQPQQAGRERVDINIFYEPLAEHGSWVRHPDYDYVFVPSGLDASWRPYQEGRWLWTDDYGWYWDSAEPFAWATYHYGRWGYEPAYGWFWVPGDTWAPAWVTWRSGGGKTGWAAIAPDSRGYAYGAPRVMDPPVAESWVFVDNRYLAAPELALHVAPIAQIAVWLSRDNPRVYQPLYRDGVVTTRFVDRNDYASVIEGGIPSRRVVFVDNYRDEFVDRGGYVGIYGPRVARANRVPPPPRFERELPQDRRILVRNYVGERVPGLAAPSAALLSVIDDSQRRQLREQRWSGNNRAYEREIDQLRERQRDRIQKTVEEANRNAGEMQEKRLEAVKARNEKLQQRVEQRQERAQQVMDKIRQERPNTLPARATDDARPGAPGARPGMPNVPPPGAGDAARPGAPGTPPGTPQRNPDAPTTPPDRTPPNAARPDTPRSGQPERSERQAEPDRARQPDAASPASPAERQDRRTQPDQGRQPETPPNRPGTPAQPRPDGNARPEQNSAPNRPAVPTNPDRGREDRPSPGQMDQPKNAPSPRADRERPERPSRDQPRPVDRAATPDRAAPDRPAPQRAAPAERPANRAQGDGPAREPAAPAARERAQPGPTPGGAAAGAARPGPATPAARTGGAGSPGGAAGAPGGDGPGRN
ncbi:DUF6600 domain-containing protein [Xanthobacter sp. 126]|uniref:DUF6600 domain-containing protein n=1 Tax=Xanthobacter sp. 126 TaxID=1131814 RepID=UPI00045E8801|nr:DUF6600 domain-containing protein [Xanthobacter sp. 126]